MTSPYMISDLDFVRFYGPIPVKPQPKFAIETRPGVDGFAAILTGTRGEPFQLRAQSVFNTFSNALTAVSTYQNKPAFVPVDITYESVSTYSTFSVKYMIESVVIESIKTIPLFQKGSTVLSPATEVISIWTLIPVSTA